MKKYDVNMTRIEEEKVVEGRYKKLERSSESKDYYILIIENMKLDSNERMYLGLYVNRIVVNQLKKFDLRKRPYLKIEFKQYVIRLKNREMLFAQNEYELKAILSRYEQQLNGYYKDLQLYYKVK